MTDLAWMKVYIGDEAAVTGHLTAEEFGAYERLRRHYWQHGGLPDDDARLARITGLDLDRWTEMANAIVLLMANAMAKLEHERVEAASRRAKRVAAGKAGAAAKWGRAENNGNRIANANGNRMANAMAEPMPLPRAPAPAPDEEGLGGKVSSTHAPARETEPIPTVGSLSQAKAWLIDQGVFPADLDRLAAKMVDCSLDWAEVRRAAA